MKDKPTAFSPLGGPECPHKKKKKKKKKPDHEGASSRVRLLHCTSPGLTPAITANVGNSTVQFLVVGACVRARSLQQTMSKSL